MTVKVFFFFLSLVLLRISNPSKKKKKEIYTTFITQMSTNPEQVKCLVIDTNAIINGMSLHNTAEEFYTCPEVLAEVRSAHSKEFLSRLPFEIKLQNPSEEAMKAIIEFSKKTGDYGVLSVPDLKVLALAYTLEVRENGHENIRTEPFKVDILKSIYNQWHFTKIQI
jgi:rRNA maturation endonuclease Nob1